MKKIIYNVRIVDTNTDEYGAVVIRKGKIESVVLLGKDVSNICVAPSLRKLIDSCDEKINAKGLVLMPAFVDWHAHFRYPGQGEKEDLETGLAAARAGGFSTVVLMPNTNPVVSSQKEALAIMDEIKLLSDIKAFQTVSITKNFDGRDISHLNDLDKSIVPIITEDGFDVASESVMKEAMKIAAKKGLVVSCHCEDAAFVPLAKKAREEGNFKKAEKLLQKAEDTATKRNLKLALETGCRVHIAHCSTKKSLAYVRQAKKKERFPGQITLEVTPHHACLSYEMKGLDKELVNPPLRSEKDRKAVVKAIQKGLVDVIATDHAPHTLEDKKNGACGFSGLETAFSLCYTELVKTGKLSLSKLSELMSSNPAQMLGLDKGFITEGLDANLVLLDLEASFFIDSKDFKSKGKYTPIQGKKLFGRII